MPKSGVPESMIAFADSIAYVQASGSPGPFERKTPSGRRASASFAVVVAGTTRTSQPDAARRRRMFRLIPKS